MYMMDIDQNPDKGGDCWGVWLGGGQISSVKERTPSNCIFLRDPGQPLPG